MTVTVIPNGSLTYAGFSPITGGIAILVPAGGLAYLGQIVIFGASSGVTKVHLPPPNVPYVDAAGRIRPEWYKFLENIFRRMGGAEEDLIAQSATLAQTASSTVTAVSAANTALAETVAAVQVEVSANTTYIENYGPRIKSLEEDI